MRREGNVIIVRFARICVVVGATALCAVVPALAAGARPNIPVIRVDDIGRDNISAYCAGVTGYHTLKIGRIETEGGAPFTGSHSNAARHRTVC